VIPGRSYPERSWPAGALPSAVLEGVVYADLVFPSFILGATGLTGEIVDADLTLPALVVEAGQIGADAVFPALSIEATGLAGEIADARLVLPPVSSEAEASTVASGFHGAALTLPSLLVQATALRGNLADVALELPPFSAQGFVSVPITYQASLALLPLVLDAYATQTLQETYRGVAVNLAHQGVSEYDLAFNTLCLFNGVSLGADSEGIYAMESDRDEAALIEAEVRTGITDMGTNLLKRATDAYLAFKGEGAYEFSTLSDNDVETSYALVDGETASHTKKQDLGKGIRSKYWGFGFKNTDGSDFELQAIRVRMEPSQRRR
jgi:hypothetical protein